jgi:hypothetical protein
VEIELLASDFNDPPTFLENNPFFQYRVHNRVHLILNILNNKSLPLLQTKPQEILLELRMIQVSNRMVPINRVLILPGDPILALPLGID